MFQVYRLMNNDVNDINEASFHSKPDRNNPKYNKKKKNRF